MSVAIRRGCLILVATLLLTTIGGLPVRPVAAGPAAPQTRAATVDGLAALAPVDPSLRPFAGGASTAGAEETPVRSGVVEAPHAFVSLGITGTGPAPELRVRTRDLDGQWSSWTELEQTHSEHGPDEGTPEAARAAAARPGWTTELFWAGPSTHVEIETAGAPPTTLEVTFIDTAGLSESVVERVGRWARSLTLGGEPVQAASTSDSGLRPDIVSRAEWGANESWRSGTHAEHEVKFGVLHHTVNANDYTRAEAPQLVRSIYWWHTSDQGNGWDDIGYNFLIDRFGTIYEGRYGGVEKGIQGAHAGGWNSGSFGVSLIGSFNDYNPDWDGVEAIADLFAWKYAVHGLNPDPDDRVWHNGYEVRRLEGHRNLRSGYVSGSGDSGFRQDCPGEYLYWQTPNLRNKMIPARLDAAFTDVDVSHRFHREIVWSAATSVANGYRDGSFRPARTVTRQSMAAFLYRLAGEPAVRTTAGFTDVDPDHPFHDAIAWAAERGITNGFDDGTFRPGDVVTRQASAAFLYRYAGEPTAPDDSGFDDVGEDHPFHDAIAWTASEGITHGYADNTFAPARGVARQAAVTFLHRATTD